MIIKIKVNKASILIIALWSLCLLTVFAVYLGFGIRQKMTLAKRLDQKQKLRLFAEGGVKIAVSELKKEILEQKTAYALKDLWSENPSLFEGMSIGDSKVDIFYEYSDQLSKSKQIRYGLVDEERKININKADIDLLERFFTFVLDSNGIDISPRELAASIIDWRDSDSMLSFPGSAEDAYYKNTSIPYETKNSDIEMLEELFLIKGVNKDIFEKIKEYITIYSNGKININTASRTVLVSLGLSENVADKIIAFRCGKDNTEATLDDNVFNSTGEILPYLISGLSLKQPEVESINEIIQKYLICVSENFMIRSVARLAGGKSFMEVNCIFNKIGKFLYWQER